MIACRAKAAIVLVLRTADGQRALGVQLEHLVTLRVRNLPHTTA